MERKIKPIAATSMVVALSTWFRSRRRFRRTGSRCPRIKATMAINTRARVVVFTPPPVEAGEAPINMSKRISSRVGRSRAALSRTLKPAVRAPPR